MDLPKLFKKPFMDHIVIAVPVICVSVYLTVTALDPDGESFIGRGTRRLKELTLQPKDGHNGHQATIVLVGEEAAGEGYP